MISPKISAFQVIQIIVYNGNWADKTAYRFLTLYTLGK